MIMINKYWMGREKRYAEELTSEVRQNAENLIFRVNTLLDAIEWKDREITSGWRPVEVNIAQKGALNSYHIYGRAVDLRDMTGLLGYNILQNYSLLEELNLWLEYPIYTKGWVHLDTGDRKNRAIRTFLK